MSKMTKVAKKIHFIGIGGIGVSYLAQWYLTKGWQVSGSNLTNEPILTRLREKGAKVRVGKHRKENIPKGTTLVIYTLAAGDLNPERIEAKNRGIPELSHAEALGELVKNYYGIAVAGSHGKSTTTALAGLLLRRAKLNPTVFLGSILKEFSQTNCLIGRSPYLVFEACEWKGAFWNYHPQIAIITNIDREHLDFYKNFAGVKKGFKKFLANLPPWGIIIANADDPIAKQIALESGKQTILYSENDAITGSIRKVLKIPGKHNVSNALAVSALAKTLGIPQKTYLEAIGAYRGSWRRFEYRGMLNGAKVFDDYGHHPTEIKATLSAGKTILPKNGRLWCMFQPHQYHRLETLFRDFVSAFDEADQVIILPVYAVAGRERRSSLNQGQVRRGLNGYSIDAESLASALVKRGVRARYAASFKQAAGILKKELSKGDISILMGAGDITKIHQYLW